MGLDGGGAGGGGILGVGDAFTGPAEALEIVGDFAYAYSGPKQIDSVAVEHLIFTSGNYLFVGEISMIGAVYRDNLEAGTQSACIINFNGTEVFTVKLDTARENMPNPEVFPIIIPSYTDVSISIASQHTTTDYFTAVNLTGRIYRG